jgi:hypothetical protein
VLVAAQDVDVEVLVMAGGHPENPVERMLAGAHTPRETALARI